MLGCFKDVVKIQWRIVVCKRGSVSSFTALAAMSTTESETAVKFVFIHSFFHKLLG